MSSLMSKTAGLVLALLQRTPLFADPLAKRMLSLAHGLICHPPSLMPFALLLPHLPVFSVPTSIFALLETLLPHLSHNH
jgi:hypothetical protein